jgi:hypothetical protein
MPTAFVRLDAGGSSAPSPFDLRSPSALHRPRRPCSSLAQGTRMSPMIPGARHEGGFSCSVAWPSAS